MDEQALQEISVRSASDRYSADGARYQPYEMSLMVNSHSHGFYMGVRHAESARSRRRSWVLPASKSPPSDTVARRLAAHASDQYVNHTYPSISKEDRAIVQAALFQGFVLGLRYGWGTVAGTR